MTIEHVLAVLPVTDFDAARAWYQRLFGAAPTNIPMPGQLVEWRAAETGWVQVTVDAERAGSGQLNLAVDDLAAHTAALAARELVTGEVVDANKGVQLAEIKDPDGNTINFIGNFRVEY